MDIQRLIIASVAVKGVFRRYAQLSADEKAEVTKKVKQKLKEKGNGDSEVDSDERVVPEDTNDAVLDTKDNKVEVPARLPADEVPAEEVPAEEPPAEEPPVEEPPADDMMGIVDGLVQEVETIKSDGKVEQSEVMGLFENMMQMVTLLVQTKAAPEPKEASMAARVAADYIAKKGRGNQIRRKDKDQMSDNGGISKGRDREPNQKPPRDDVKKRYRRKRRTEADPDLDRKDPDTKKGSDVHQLDRKREFLGGTVPEDNYYRDVLWSSHNIISSVRGISEKSFGQVRELEAELNEFLRQADVMEIVDRFEGQDSRASFCAEYLLFQYSKV
jgi:hypothetical protein